jgi:DNA-binding XRE family transcriptional regulator
MDPCTDFRQPSKDRLKLSGQISSPILPWQVNLTRLERARVLHGWTRRQLAEAAHVDPDTLTDLFRSRRRPTLGTVQAVSRAVGLSLEDVINFAEN